MIIGIFIAVVLLFVGLPWWAAIGVGIGYTVIAFVITPRSAYVGGLFGPRPRPGEIPEVHVKSTSRPRSSAA